MIKKNWKSIYYQLLKLSSYYQYCYAYFENSINTEILESRKNNLQNQLFSEYHLFDFALGQCLDLAYEDRLQKLKQKAH